MKRAESYLQHVTTSKWDVLTFFAATFPISRFSDIGGAALGGGGGGCVLIPIRGDVHNSKISMAERLDVVGALQRRSVIGIHYSNENIARHNCHDLSLNTP